MDLQGSEQAGAAMTVLIVEDDEAVAELVAHTLAREDDYDVSIVHDCAGARAAVERTEPDLVFLDLKLPDGDGLDVLEWMKQRGHESAVIVMTAFRQEEKALRAFDLGAADFISKPFKPRELLTRARHVLRAHAT